MSNYSPYTLAFVALLSACDAANKTPAPAPANKATTTTTPAATSTSVATPAGDVYNVRGVAAQGVTRRTVNEMVVTDAQLSITLAGLALKGTMSMTMNTTEDLEILAVADGQIQRGRLIHVVDKATNKLTITMPDGSSEPETSSDNGALHGRVETIERTGQHWTRTLEGAAATPEQARLLGVPPVVDQTYPSALKIGESWTETGPEMRRWFGSDFTTMRGQVQNTLRAVEVRAGEKVAIIDMIGEVSGTMLDNDNNELELAMGLQGTTHRSLDRAVDLEYSLDGAIKVSGKMIEDGQAIDMTVTGHYKAKGTGSLR